MSGGVGELREEVDFVARMVSPDDRREESAKQMP